MKGAVATESGLQIRDMPKPQAGPNQVLVEVRAAGLNRADLNAAKGSGVATRDSFGKPIGLEWAGVVAEVGAGVQDVRTGDRVMCSGSGGYAEYAVCDAGRAMPIPDDSMSFQSAAVLPLALLTMHDAIASNGRLKQGEAVLIQGASSGVGLMGLQIAGLMGAGIVIGSSANDERRARLTEFGADAVVDTRNAGWADAVMDATGGQGVDLIVDMISGPVIEQSMKAARVRGRIVNVGRLGGTRAEFNFDLHALKRLDYIGVTFRTRSLEEVLEIVRRMRADLWDALAAGQLALPIDSSFPLDEAVAAQSRMRANEHFGKIVLTM
jgi:NADPH:quinone reductase-like Zn-dependent oxidoreductase